MKKLVLSLLALIALYGADAQALKKSYLDVPDIEGYTTLRGDLHNHTVFSDGHMWPKAKIDEAYKTGMDVLALTDHDTPRNRINKAWLKDDMNAPYDMSAEYAESMGIVLIRGIEITRALPPGHLCAIFVQDVNKFLPFVNAQKNMDGSNIKDILQEARAQGAYITWNHPWYEHPRNLSQIFPMHQELLDAGLIDGIEVHNGRADQNVLKWCIDRGLNPHANSDSHAPLFYTAESYRPCNLFFVKERSAAGVREALDNHRTVAYANKMLYGREELLRALFEKSFSVSVDRQRPYRLRLEIRNAYGLPLNIEVKDNGGLEAKNPVFWVDGHSATSVLFDTPGRVATESGSKYTINIVLRNFVANLKQPLTYSFEVTVP